MAVALPQPRETRFGFSLSSAGLSVYDQLQFTARSCLVSNWSSLTLYVKFDLVRPIESITSNYDAIIPAWSMMGVQTPAGGAAQFTLYALGVGRIDYTVQQVYLDFSEEARPVGFWELPSSNTLRPLHASGPAARFYTAVATTVPHLGTFQTPGVWVFPLQLWTSVSLLNKAASGGPSIFMAVSGDQSFVNVAETQGYIDPSAFEIEVPAQDSFTLDIWLQPPGAVLLRNRDTTTDVAVNLVVTGV